MNSSSNTFYVVQEEGYGGSNLLGVFSTLQKAESFKKKFKEIYPNKYSSSSDFWNIRNTIHTNVYIILVTKYNVYLIKHVIVSDIS